MKKLLLFIILFSPFILIAQEHTEGIFKRTGLVDTYEYLKFSKDGMFEYKKGGDLGEPKPSKGEYLFLDDLLILNFNNSQTKELSFHKTEIWTNQNDSITVNFTIMDLEGTPVENAWINKRNSTSAIRTDNKGHGTFRLEKEKNSANFLISWIGFETYQLQIDLKFSQNIQVYLTEDLQEIPIRNQIDTLKITESNKNYFISEGNIKWEKLEQ